VTSIEAESAEAGWQRAVTYIRLAVATYPDLAWPGEIDDILDRARGFNPISETNLALARLAAVPPTDGEDR